MKTFEQKSIPEWIEWFASDGSLLAEEERDVRVDVGNGFSFFGSIESVSTKTGDLLLCPYNSENCPITVNVRIIKRIDVFKSRRSLMGRKQRKACSHGDMRLSSRASIDDTCP